MRSTHHGAKCPRVEGFICQSFPEKNSLVLQLPAAADPERTNLRWASTHACLTASQPVTMRPCVLVLSSPRSPTCLLYWPLPQRVPPQFLSADRGVGKQTSI